jgi:hypothetical protein
LALTAKLRRLIVIEVQSPIAELLAKVIREGNQ